MVRVRRGLRRRRRDIIPYLEKRPCKFPARTRLHLASHSCLSAGRESGDGDETPQEPWRHSSKKPKAHHPPPSQPVARRHHPVACAPVYFPWSHRVFLSISACCGARFASFEVSSWGEGAGNATIDRICIYLHRAMVASCRNLGRGVAHLNCQLMKRKGAGKSRFIPGRGHFAKGKSSRWRSKETVVATTHNPHRYIFAKQISISLSLP